MIKNEDMDNTFQDSRAEIANVMAASLAQCGIDRDAVAKSMSAMLGRTISKHMLDAYASEARTTHTPALDVAIAFDKATNSMALCNYFANKLGVSVATAEDVSLMKLGRITKDRFNLSVHEARIRHEANIADGSELAAMQTHLMDESNLAIKMLLSWLIAKNSDSTLLGYLRQKTDEFREGGVEAFPYTVETLDQILTDARNEVAQFAILS